MEDSAILKNCGYTIGRNLGEGSYAKVKSAYSEHLRCHVAVKIIDRKKAPHDFLERFLPREIAILPVMNHHSVVKTYEIFESPTGKIYIIMELCVQGDLLEFIKTRGAITEILASKWFCQLVLALKYCHDLDIVHRDLKCENILLDNDFNIKLSDFGFARRLCYDKAGKIVLSQTFCGSAAYAAPEVLQGIPYHPKVYDIWSLGIILFIMVSGSMPYNDSNIKKMLRIQKEHRVDFPHSKHLSSDCKDLIYRMLQPNVTHRLTISEILNHSWLQGALNPHVPGNVTTQEKEMSSTDLASVLKQEETNSENATCSSGKPSATCVTYLQKQNALWQRQASTTIHKASKPKKSGTVGGQNPPP
ncbi:testis-specific serine/threonine-protein kinase 1-like [Mixophyes fleayi]|uniref:testis-specific serine/threonine-protein kinase 1-like n=1 Tax=Mixophyes fleayi TaxID=3061075 RepID=UPI003F4DE010